MLRVAASIAHRYIYCGEGIISPRGGFVNVQWLPAEKIPLFTQRLDGFLQVFRGNDKGRSGRGCTLPAPWGCCFVVTLRLLATRGFAVVTLQSGQGARSLSLRLGLVSGPLRGPALALAPVQAPSLTAFPRFSVTTTSGTVVAQLEGRALGLAALAHLVPAVAHLDLVEGAALVLVVGAAVHRAFDAGVGLIRCHGHFLLVSALEFPNTKGVCPAPVDVIHPCQSAPLCA